MNWIRRYILFHNKRHPKDMGTAEIEAFLTHLAEEKNVGASTQNQALSTLLCLYRTVLHIDLDGSIDAVRAKRPARLPTVLARSDVREIIKAMSGSHKLMMQLLYGGGLRLMECLRLRVKDVDCEMLQITVRDGKGYQDRTTMLPEHLRTSLQEHLQSVKRLHAEDLDHGYGCVTLPDALERK